ncbi:MAG: SMC-Scp complex subunit ScpB [Eubacterium sp.]
MMQDIKVDDRIGGIIESILFAAGEPVSIKELESVLELDSKIVKEIMVGLDLEYKKKSRGLRLVQVNNTWQLSTKPEYFNFIEKILGRQEVSGLSKAAFETLAIIAYRQPVTRIDIDNLRGVSSNSSVSRLLDKGLIKEAGRLETSGRPILYKTTPAFLKNVHIKNLDELPSFEEFSEGEQQKLNLEEIE